MAFKPNDDALKYLMALGLADANGNILVGSQIDPTITTASGTVQNTEYTLNSVALPASLFNGARRGAVIVAAATTAANANAKNIKVYLGSTAICTITGTTASAKDVIILIVLLRTGLDAQQAMAIALVDGAVIAASSILATATEDDASALTVALKSANTAAAAASATGKGLVVLPLGS